MNKNKKIKKKVYIILKLFTKFNYNNNNKKY